MVARRVCTEVRVSDVTPDIMTNIIDHAYGCDVIITHANFEPLLIAADMFQISSLLEMCCQYLQSQLSLENCIAVVRLLSHFPQCEATRRQATQMFLDNFTLISKMSSDFLKLSLEELETVLRADRLNVRHELEVLDAIIGWLTDQSQVRTEDIARLVSCLRIGLVSPRDVDTFFFYKQASNPLILQVMEIVLQQQRQQMEVPDSSVFSPRLPRDILITVGGSDFGYPLNLVEAFDCRACTWSVVQPNDFAPRSYHGMAVLGKEVFIIGGFSGQEYLNSCCKFKPETLQWESVTPMNIKRCYIGTAVVKGDIFAVGGYDGLRRLRCVERYERRTNQWTEVSPMLQQRSDAGVASLRDQVYVCGGFNGVLCLWAVESYDPLTDQWSALAAMTSPRSGPGLATYRDCLYVLGGFDGTDNKERLATMEVYLPDTDQWIPLASMRLARSNMACEVLEEVLFAVGGYNGRRTTNVVEGYNFATNTWNVYPPMNHKRSALSMCKVSGLDNTEELLGRNRRRN